MEDLKDLKKQKISKQKKKYYQDNHEEILKKKKQYRKDNREILRKRDRQWRKNHPEREKEWENLKNYNLSHEDWLKIWENQDGKCAICGKPFKKPFDDQVDHNHKTNKIRGLLCKKCNGGIGFLNDNPELTAKATEYLLRRRILNG